MTCPVRRLLVAERTEQSSEPRVRSAQPAPVHQALPAPGVAVASMSEAELRGWLASTFGGRLSAEQLKAADEAFARLGLDGDTLVETVEPDSKGFQAEDKLIWLGLESWLARALAKEL